MAVFHADACRPRLVASIVKNEPPQLVDVEESAVFAQVDMLWEGQQMDARLRRQTGEGAEMEVTESARACGYMLT